MGNRRQGKNYTKNIEGLLAPPEITSSRNQIKLFLKIDFKMISLVNFSVFFKFQIFDC